MGFIDNVCPSPAEMPPQRTLSGAPLPCDPDGPPCCFGGTETGVAHRACNRRHGAEVVRPLDAKATRNRQKHIGAFQTRHKLPGGRMDWRKRKIDGSVVLRH